MMGTPDEKKNRLPKAATILGLIFLVSLGLCGINFLALSGNVMNGAEGPLFVTAYLEVIGMAGSAMGLLIVGIIAIVRAVNDQFSTKVSDSVSIIEKDEDK